MGNAAACCVKRDEELLDELPRDRSATWRSLPDECVDEWFECIESDSEDDAAQLREAQRVRERSVSFVRLLSDGPKGLPGRKSSLQRIRLKPASKDRVDFAVPVDDRYDCHTDAVIENVRAAWDDRQRKGKLPVDVLAALQDGFPELDEWTDQVTVRRMLRAMDGNVAQAADLLFKAIDCRVKDRTLFQSLHCEVVCDIRVIGRDKERRPTVYMCARSQDAPLITLLPQIFLAFEAAVRLTHPDGQLGLIADMHCLRTGLNVDQKALQQLGGTLGSVYADRLNWIMIVDFSRLATFMWTMCKPWLSPKTQKKISFVREVEARERVKSNFLGPSCERILSAFDINRDGASTTRDRQAHAAQTTICDVPMGGDACRPLPTLTE